MIDIIEKKIIGKCLKITTEVYVYEKLRTFSLIFVSNKQTFFFLENKCFLIKMLIGFLKTIWFYFVTNCSSATRLNISVQILFKLLSISNIVT